MKLKVSYHATLMALSMLTLAFINNAVMAQSSNHKKYVKVPAGYVMVLTQDDNIFDQLESFAVKERIPSANFTGMGFVNIIFGFFDAATKQYRRQEFKNVELVSMHGSIAWQKGKPSVHSHAVVSGSDFHTHGGHILSGTVGTGSLEIMIVVHDKPMERVFDEGLGANVLRPAE